MDNKISVIIIAHDRADFIGEAIKSLQFQTIEKKLFETILVKNFTDNDIDNLSLNLGFKMILTDVKSAYEKLLLGFLNSTGNIITFLEDDDTYSSERLGEIYTFFNVNDNVCYYHNHHTVISSNGKILFANGLDVYSKDRFFFVRKHSGVDISFKTILKLKEMRGDFNISSIAVKRELIEEAIAKYGTQMFAGDIYLFLAALGSDCDIALDMKPLTNYRVHSTNFSVPMFLGGDINDFLNRRIALMNFQKENNQRLSAIFNCLYKGTALGKFSDFEYAFTNLNLYILSGKFRLREVYTNLFIFIRSLKLNNVKLLFEFLLLVIGLTLNKQLYKYLYISFFFQIKQRV